MMNLKLRTIIIFAGLSTLLACNNSETSGILASSVTTPKTTETQALVSFPESGNNLRISLTDAPSKDLKSVFVNIDHVELFVRKNASENKRLLVGYDTGMVDLMTLRNGVLLPLQDLNIASGLEITGLRLVLKGDNNHSIKSDDSRCEMQTPSGQQSGIKIHLAQPFTLNEDSVYSMVMDFDAQKSVVVKGNGDCLLKPVLKLLQVTKTTINPTPEPTADPTTDPTTDPTSDGDGHETPPDNTVTPVTDGTDSNTNVDSPTGGDFEIPMDPVDEPAIITTQDTFAL